MACEIELVPLSGIKPSLSIRIPPEPPLGYWEDDPFTDDEEDDEEEEPSLEEILEFLDNCPNVRGKVVEDGEVFRLWGPAKELDWLENESYFYEVVVPAIRKAFDVETVEVGNDE